MSFVVFQYKMFTVCTPQKKLVKNDPKTISSLTNYVRYTLAKGLRNMNEKQKIATLW